MFTIALPLLFSPFLVRADVLRYSKTPNGFDSPPRGWNSFALQTLANGQFELKQANVLEQCDAMRQQLGEYGFEYCSLDNGWSLPSDGDDNGRITYEPSLFDLPALADHLHDNGAKLGINILPGFFANDIDKTIFGTDIKLSSIQADEENPCGDQGRCNINYDAPGAQEWCDSNVQQFADWGVDLLKLDSVTPGSSGNNSGSVACYHKAIENSERQIRLDITWKQERNDTLYDIWKTNADSMRTDQETTTTNQTTLTTWSTIQRAIEEYRQYILLQLNSADALTIYPDLSSLLVGNAQNLTGLTDRQRTAVMSHWLGAGANLILGSDLTALDDVGRSLLTNPLAYTIANFTAQHPMVPTEGNTDPEKGQRRQIWIAGPDSTTGIAVVLLANYGAGNNTDNDDTVSFELSPKDLGLTASGYYAVEDVWAGGEANDLDFDETAAWTLDASGDAVLLRFTPSVTSGGGDKVKRAPVPAEHEQEAATSRAAARVEMSGWGAVFCLGLGLQVFFLIL